MKLKINKGDKSLTYDLINSWSDVTLEKWAKLVAVKTSTKSDEAIETMGVLANIPKQVMRELSLSDVSMILNKVAKMQQSSKAEFVRRIELDGKQYGFHPNLEDITLGEYADIETLIKDGLEGNLHLLMAILYRPVIEVENDKYTIEPYDGNITLRAERMKLMTATEVENSMVFFWTLGNKLLRTLPLYLMELAQKTIRSTLRQGFKKSGVGLA
jgi:hypothetical protein|tara:strand:+ start:293 stop:934 length:642 start_codon:yes stop_codon:yes gene_type:complete